MSEIYRSVDLHTLQSLPKLTAKDREALERILWLAPDVALATAAAVVRSHLPDVHEALFPRGKQPSLPQLARALVYLGLAMSAPVQGKILPILSAEDLRGADRQVSVRLAQWGRAAFIGAQDVVESDAIPDPELRALLDVLVQRASARSPKDPRWLRAIAYGAAGSFYATLAQACADQFGSLLDAGAASAQLERIARTRDLLADVLTPDEAARQFDPAKQAEYIARLRRFGWQEFTASRGRTLRELADEARRRGLQARNAFALSAEWEQRGASLPTTGQRYFIRPSLLPDSLGLALWAQEERMKPLQKMLAGDPRETGLRLCLGSVELFLDYLSRVDRADFLDGYWTRTSNHFDGLQTRFGAVSADSYAITIFPGARLDEQVGVCPVIEVTREAE